MWSFNRFAANFLGDDAANSGPFKRQYNCYPVSFVGRESLENGNKILLPQSALNALAHMNVTWPMLFELRNPSTGRRTHGGVLEFSAEEGTCYMPYWLMKNLLLHEGDLVEVVNTSLPKGTFVKLQPVSKEFLQISDHRALLEHCLRNYAALTKGDFILIQHGRKSYEIEILECLPSDAVSVIETDMQVDFAPPMDYIEPTPIYPNPSTTSGGSGDSGALKAGHSTDDSAANISVAKTSKRLPGGVRTECKEYDALFKNGRRPGLVGQFRLAQMTPITTPDNAFRGRGKPLTE